jgi:3-isopropylmalate dehydrogenase
MTANLTLAPLPGDGIDPEITAATRQRIEAATDRFRLGLRFKVVEIGFAALAAEGSTFPDVAFDANSACDGVVMGPVSHNACPPCDKGGLNALGELRHRLDMFANIRPARSRAFLPPVAGKFVDLVVLRENTKGFEADRSMHFGPGESMPTHGLALATRKVTRAAHTAATQRQAGAVTLESAPSDPATRNPRLSGIATTGGMATAVAACLAP